MTHLRISQPFKVSIKAHDKCAAFPIICFHVFGFICSISLVGQKSFLVLKVPGRRSNTQHFTTKDISYANSLGPETFESDRFSLRDLFHVLFSLRDSSPVLHFSRKTFHLFCSNDPSSSVAVSGGSRACTPSH